MVYISRPIQDLDKCLPGSFTTSRWSCTDTGDVYRVALRCSLVSKTWLKASIHAMHEPEKDYWAVLLIGPEVMSPSIDVYRGTEVDLRIENRATSVATRD